MDHHTIRNLKQQVAQNGGHSSDRFVYVEPEASLEKVVQTLIEKRCAMAPIVSVEDNKVRRLVLPV